MTSLTKHLMCKTTYSTCCHVWFHTFIYPEGDNVTSCLSTLPWLPLNVAIAITSASGCPDLRVWKGSLLWSTVALPTQCCLSVHCASLRKMARTWEEERKHSHRVWASPEVWCQGWDRHCSAGLMLESSTSPSYERKCSLESDQPCHWGICAKMCPHLWGRNAIVDSFHCSSRILAQ
jgi:hypothetical protein